MTEPIHIISLGAGVQSSTMALMAAHGEITPMPHCAIFADTQAEPEGVYKWLDWLEKQLPFPVKRVTAGSIIQDVFTLRMKRDNSGFFIHSNIPAFVTGTDGKEGMIPRQCTTNFKIEPLKKAVRQIVKPPRGCKEVRAIQWIGISLDEVQRMKENREPWLVNRWPLVDMRMSRHDCLRWMEAKGYPKPPRSACFFCPYKSDAEWRRLRAEEPKLFERAVLFEKGFQHMKKAGGLDGLPFLHARRVPLDTIDFSSEEERGQTNLFNNECEGMCGV
jgi:hypothetical protein